MEFPQKTRFRDFHCEILRFSGCYKNPDIFWAAGMYTNPGLSERG
jgi:hypothetical protein